MDDKYKNDFFDDDANDWGKNSTKDKGLLVADSWLYKMFVKSSYRLLAKPLAIIEVMKKALYHLKKYDSVKEFTSTAQEQMGTIIRLSMAYAKGKYTAISKMNIALTLGAVLYFVSPFDLIPDFLGIGLLDDIALLSWVFKNLKTEMNQFLEWEDSQKELIIKIEAKKNK